MQIEIILLTAKQIKRNVRQMYLSSILMAIFEISHRALLPLYGNHV